MSGGESNYSDEKSMQEDVDDLSIGGYESGVQCVREIIAVNDERLPCDTSDEYNSTIGSDCSFCETVYLPLMQPFRGVTHRMDGPVTTKHYRNHSQQTTTIHSMAIPVLPI
jgi:hypothetical protein